jgi:predicted Zn-dependent peptidase
MSSKVTAYEKTEFANGVRLILVPMEGVNSVATSVMVECGSRYETREINGISHFLEHMVFKGTEKYPTTDDVNIIERVGGLQNAYTDIDITSFHNKVLSTDWELALDINRELALAPKLEQQYIDKERDVILEEMKRYEDELSAKVGETFHRLMYPSSTLGMKIIGEEASLRSSDASTLRKYHDTWYKPDRFVVTLAGDVKSQMSKIIHGVEDSFGKEKGVSGADFEHITADTQDAPHFEVVTKPDAAQAHITLGVRTFQRGNDERFAWSLFNLIMGVSFTSRLFKEVREKKGLCYHIRSNSDNWADVGYWSIYAGVATDKVEEAVKAIVNELAKSAASGVTDEELVVAKKRLKTMLAFKGEDPEFMGEYYGRQELFHEPIITLEDYIRKIESISKENINTLVKKYLITRTLNLALVTSKPKDDSLLNLLRLS